MGIGREGNVKWVDGLRGIASTLVVLTHIARSFDGELFVPTDGDGKPPRLLQLPYLRILVQGRLGVTIFSFVTGFVCALKPLKLTRQGNREAALASMGKSALRRVPRLVLPAAVATLVICLYAQLGAFDVAHRCDAWWIHSTSPQRQPGIVSAARNAVYNIVTTWTRSTNEYDGGQWTLLPLLRGSMMVYVYVAATVLVQPRWRMVLSVLMWAYMYVGSDSAFGMQFFWGVFLSDLQQHPPALAFLSTHPRTSRLLSLVLVFLGLTIASYPEQQEQRAAWSSAMRRVLERVLPKDPDFPRFASGIGLELVALGLHFSPYLRELLSSRPLLWLGRQSFAVYLLHGPLLRTVLAWMVYGVSMPADETNDKGDVVPGVLRQPGPVRLLLACAVWIPLNYAVANLWTAYVDPWCARLTERVVARLVGDEKDGPGATPLPTVLAVRPTLVNGVAGSPRHGAAGGVDERVAEKELEGRAA